MNALPPPVEIGRQVSRERLRGDLAEIAEAMHGDTIAAVRFTAVLVALVAGCSSSDLGAPCSATSPCAGDAVCDLTDPDGPSCVSADGDDDADGIVNERDFCQHLDGGAFDEDLDGYGDNCDACPIAPPPATR